MKILIVEDESKLAEGIRLGLERKGYAADILTDGAEALTRMSVHRTDYDLVILDLMLPSLSGLEVCTEARALGVVVPILVLTARGETENKVRLLLAGADDYLVKPFSFDELLARIAALLRRPREKVPEMLSVAGIELNPMEHTVTKDGRPINLTLKEFMLIEHFLRHPNEVISREDLLAHLWDFNYESFSNVIDVHVKNLRKKLDEADSDGILETVRGIGYRLRA